MSTGSPPSPTVPPPPPPPPPDNTNANGQGQGQGRGSSGNSSSLYLVTFLATLFLLLFVSCSIVLRSYVLRRRYQRRLEEAMAVGMVLAPRSQGSRLVRFGAKPKIFDSWIANGGEKWKEMHPFAAQPVFVKRKHRDSITLKTLGTIHSTLAISESPSDHPTPTHPGVRSLIQRIRRHPVQANRAEDADPWQSGPTRPEFSQCPRSSSSPYKNRVEMLQVSVLIAMPSQDQTRLKNALIDSEDDIEEPLPELVLGVTRVHYRQRKTQEEAKSTPLPSPDCPFLS